MDARPPPVDMPLKIFFLVARNLTLWHCFGMTGHATNLSHPRRVFVLALVLTVMVSGIPATQVHTHSDARPGHVHDVVGPGKPDARSSALDGSANVGVLHAHEVGATVLALISTFNVDIATRWQTDGGIPLPVAKLPDHTIQPLYRPPIV